MSPASRLDGLAADVRACRICADHLPLGPRPVFRVAPGARIAVIGQAPGTRVHESGVPWDDASGDHLRAWLGVDSATFDRPEFAILPMGFCYPGRKGGGDAPPRPECAPTWHASLLSLMPSIELTLLVGMYAQRTYLGRRRKRTLTDTVRGHADYAPEYLPLPHPSWRSRHWMARNPWFETDVLPLLRTRVHALL